MEIVSNVALISINATLVVQLVSFLIFLAIMNRFMFRPLREVMSERETYIRNLKKDIESAKADYDETLVQIKRQEDDARSEADKVRQALESDGGAEAEKRYAATNDQIMAMRREVEQDVRAQLDKAREQLARQAQALSTAMIEKVLERKVTP